MELLNGSSKCNDEKALRILLNGIVALFHFEKKNLGPFFSPLEQFCPIYLYVASLIRIYPFAKTTNAYIRNWPNEIKNKYSDLFLLSIAEDTLKQEKGHDELIVKDLNAFNIPLVESMKILRSERISIWIESFYTSVQKDPLHFLAWLYFFEKRTVQANSSLLSQWKSMLGSKVQAFHFFSIHSPNGLEKDHVEIRERWISCLDQENQLKVVRELYRIALELPSLAYFDLNDQLIIRYFDTLPSMCKYAAKRKGSCDDPKSAL